ncbi:FAD-dependent isoamyl alcohol oxidase [Penicillium angulare]|uniref:FAD-dependent isoamyl alcohol oxidase n=1 Tax=Penicillium angulare TaxID=116970 RepID=A0A9W9G7G2_9EURO|nr:FAD-dependent isoamyl alcohol oxidase [Penicillium angulare]
MRPKVSLNGSLLALLSAPLALAEISHGSTCRNIHGDAGWPRPYEWAELNQTVNGQLIQTVPMGSVCHHEPFGVYNQTACDELRQDWDFRHWKFKVWEMGQIHVTHPSEIMNPYYQNQSCDPFTSPDSPCELGNYASYSINVTGPEDVLAGIRFAKEKNIRLVIKNTGHDYHGRSSGGSSLALWMYNLKTAEVMHHYESPLYNGPAVKLGAGMGVGESYMAVHEYGYRIVGGECGTVGVAGGYSQGGGHSVLTSERGLGSDQVLEWEVVTPAGELLIATPTHNADLYWALSGGGGGTYGVVVSSTVKIFPDGPFAGGALVFNNTDTPGHEVFWKGVELWYKYFPSFTVNNNTVQFVLLNSTLDAQAINLPGQDIAAVHRLMAPYLAELDNLGIIYRFTTEYSESYYDHFNNYYGPLPHGAEPVTTILYARLVPRRVVQDPTANAKLVDTMRSLVQDGKFLIGCGVFDLRGKTHPDNAVLPAWRDAQAVCIANGFWDFEAPTANNVAVKEELVDFHAPAMDAATPGSGVYMNEVDPLYKGDWKEAMYGVNYDRLLAIKNKYDPDHMLFGHMSVGSDEFRFDERGRLCYGHSFGHSDSESRLVVQQFGPIKFEL